MDEVVGLLEGVELSELNEVVSRVCMCIEYVCVWLMLCVYNRWYKERLYRVCGKDMVMW